MRAGDAARAAPRRADRRHPGGGRLCPGRDRHAARNRRRPMRTTPMTMPNWRSLLFVPVTAERFVAKAHTRGADVIILDLEDSIPPAEKDAARAALPAAAAVVGQGGAEIAVRINRAAGDRHARHRRRGHAAGHRADAAEGDGAGTHQAAVGGGRRARGGARPADRPHPLHRAGGDAAGAAAPLRHRRGRSAHGGAWRSAARTCRPSWRPCRAPT